MLRILRPINAEKSCGNAIKIAKSPAMVYYLDSFSSTKQSPNENYARELMELHTLGVDGPFNHHDIDEVARCFTGWQINNSNGGFIFNANNHDFDEKQTKAAIDLLQSSLGKEGFRKTQEIMALEKVLRIKA